MITRPARRLSTVAVAALVAGLLGVPGAAQADQAEQAVADEQHRPLLHYTPEQNWINDPNGLLYHDGTYHLFYQHNPEGTRWGNMSWGHATSTDLLRWEEQPVAIPQTFNDDGVAIEDIFSGSAVVDHGNTSGFGTDEGPALVAIYTSAYTDAHPEHAGIQAQSLAYSTDDGETWTKYEGNPVLDRGSADFRDPKVFWYEGATESYWVMVAVEAADYEVVLYRSDDLKEWEYLSAFGPANSVGGIWECPDLFPLAVDGDPENVKWVMVVNLNPGAVAGGSGGQYFVGDFDGVTFTPETIVTGEPAPGGTLFEGFEDGYGDWTVGNEPGNRLDGPWGDAPATGAIGDQSPVTGFLGDGLVNGFLDGDWPVGTIESPAFTIDSDYINFLVGGGRHPHVPGTRLDNDPPAGETLFDFEGDENLGDAGWELTGDFVPERNPSTAGGEYYLGEGRVNTWEGGPAGDDNVGTMTSPEFAIDDDYLSFLIGGGRRTDGSLQVELLVDGRVVRSQTGPEAGALNWHSWDVGELRGQTGRLRIVDEATGGWGHLTFDHAVLGPERARARSSETSATLVVDGEVVRSATGANSETLDWASWDVRDLAGESAAIRIVDNNRSDWGHVLADEFRFADTPATSRLEAYHWLDWGKDYYATVSFGNVPDDRRLMIGWMNNWDYANDIPTGRWRGAMTLPREVALTDTIDGPRLIQKVVDQIDGLRLPATYSSVARSLPAGVEVLPVRSSTVQVDAVFVPGGAESFGLTVLSNGETGTHVGYDAARGRVFVDRTASGDTSFHDAFGSVEEAPVALADGRIALRVYVDRSSVEVFAQDGLVTITDQVFPAAGADRIAVWAEGGSAVLESLTVTPLAPAMWGVPDGDGDGDGGGDGDGDGDGTGDGDGGSAGGDDGAGGGAGDPGTEGTDVGSGDGGDAGSTSAGTDELAVTGSGLTAWLLVAGALVTLGGGAVASRRWSRVEGG